jgi:hypothetical protein
MILPAQALQAAQVRWKWVSNEGHYALEVKTVSRPYLPQDCSGVTDYHDVVLPAHALQAVQVRLKAVSNKGHFTLEAETVFHPHFPLDCSEVTE